MISEQRKHHSHPLRFNSEKYLLTRRLQKNRKESATSAYAGKTKTETMGHLYSGYAAECPGTVPVGDSASPPVTWR